MSLNLQSALRAALLERAGIAAGAQRRGLRPCVVKSIGAGRRTRDSVARLVDYIARADRLAPEDFAAEQKAALADGAVIRPGDAVAVFDEWSRPVPPQEIDAVLASWPSMEGPDDHRVRARHLVFTVPVDHPADAPRVEIAVASAIRETLAVWDNSVLWALHTDHADHPHVHAVIGTPPDAPLRLDRDGLVLDALRAALARNARASGFDVSAERRCDRPDAEPPLMKELDNLQRRVPNWTAAWGSGYIERARAGRDGHPVDPTAAARSRDAMAAEDPKLAAWYAAHRPLAFGDPGELSWEAARASATDAKALRDRAARRHGLAVLADTVDRTFPAGDADHLVHAIRARVERMAAAMPPERAGTPPQPRRERREGRVR